MSEPKKTSVKLKAAAVVVGTGLCALAFAGCSSGSSSSGSGGDSGGGSTPSASATTLPSDWPSDVPTPSGLTLVSAIHLTSPNTFNASWKGVADAASVTKEMNEKFQAAGWKTDMPFGDGTNGEIVVFTKDGAKTQLTIVNQGGEVAVNEGVVPAS